METLVIDETLQQSEIEALLFPFSERLILTKPFGVKRPLWDKL